MPYENGSSEPLVYFREILFEIGSDIDCLNEKFTLVVTGGFNADPRGQLLEGAQTILR